MPDDDDAVSSEDETGDLPADSDWLPEQLGSAGDASFAEAMATHGAMADSIRQLTSSLKVAAPLALQQAKWVETFGESWRVAIDVAKYAPKLDALKLPTSSLGKLLENFRRIDQVAKNVELIRQQSVVANWAQLTLGPSALTSWRAALEVHTRVGEMTAGAAGGLSAHSKLFEDLGRVAEAHVSLTDWAVRQDAGSRLLGEISGKPLGLWRTYVDDLSVEPSQDGLELSVATGQVGLGLLGGDTLASAAADAELMSGAVQHVEEAVLEPWQQGRLDSAEQLYARLREIDATVPGLLKGAWDNVLRDGPAAASQAAYCLTEVLDRALRRAAPDEPVLVWHAETKRAGSELHDGKPTRALRVKYIAHQAWGSHGDLVIMEYESLSKLISPLQKQLQGVKHASTGEIAMVRNLLVTAESFLMLLFLIDGS